MLRSDLFLFQVELGQYISYISAPFSPEGCLTLSPGYPTTPRSAAPTSLVLWKVNGTTSVKGESS